MEHGLCLKKIDELKLLGYYDACWAIDLDDRMSTFTLAI